MTVLILNRGENMKTNLGVIAAVFALCCALVAGPVSPARAEDQCTTQGALALALADVLGIKVTTAQDAADKLAARNIKPKLGWSVDTCLTDEVLQEIQQSYAAFTRDLAGFDRALGQLNLTDRQHPNQGVPPKPPTVSPFKP